MAVDTKLPWPEQKLPWMSKLMWADLMELSNIKPFTEENLLEHIASNREPWTNFRNDSVRHFSFADLPNAPLLDFKFFKSGAEDDARKPPETQSPLPLDTEEQ